MRYVKILQESFDKGVAAGGGLQVMFEDDLGNVVVFKDWDMSHSKRLEIVENKSGIKIADEISGLGRLKNFNEFVKCLEDESKDLYDLIEVIKAGVDKIDTSLHHDIFVDPSGPKDVTYMGKVGLIDKGINKYRVLSKEIVLNPSIGKILVVCYIHIIRDEYKILNALEEIASAYGYSIEKKENEYLLVNNENGEEVAVVGRVYITHHYGEPAYAIEINDKAIFRIMLENHG